LRELALIGRIKASHGLRAKAIGHFDRRRVRCNSTSTRIARGRRFLDGYNRITIASAAGRAA
jgi:hypothetical protein